MPTRRARKLISRYLFFSHLFPACLKFLSEARELDVRAPGYATIAALAFPELMGK